MKALLTSLALFLLAVEVYSQSQPVIYSGGLSRTITTSNTTFLTNQRLPSCYQVDYLVNDLTSISAGDLISNLYVPREDTNTPAPSSSVSIQLLRGNSTLKTSLSISSVIDQDVNFVTYLSQVEGCSISSDKKTLVRTPGDANFGCGINYYCSQFPNSTDRL
jgi:hypothetical protein